RDPLLQPVGERVDQPDHAGLGGGVVRLPQVARDAGDRGDPDDPAVVVHEALLQELGGDPLGGDQVDTEDRVPAVLVHVGEPLVASDAGVVHHHVDAAVGPGEVLGDPFGGVLGGDVEGEVVAVQLGGQPDQVVGGLWYVDPDHGRAVAGEHSRDLLPDAAGGARHQRHLAGQGPLPVGVLR